MSIVQAECRLKSLTNTAVCYGISAHWLSADALSECWAGTCSNWPSPSGPWSLRGRRGRRWALKTSPTETSNSWSTSSEDTTSLSADLTPGTCTHPGQLTNKKTLNDYFLLCIVCCIFSKPPVSAKSGRSFAEPFAAPVSSQAPQQGSEWPFGQVTAWWHHCSIPILVQSTLFFLLLHSQDSVQTPYLFSTYTKQTLIY